MKRYILKIIFAITLLNYSAATAKEKPQLATITIHLIEKNLINRKLILRLTEDYTFGTDGSKEFILKANKEGYFKWTTYLVRFPVMFTIELDNTLIVDNYLEPNDKINIEYSGFGNPGNAKPDELKIYGKGFEKFTLINLLKSAKPNNVIIKENQPFSEERINIALACLDSMYVFKKRILNQNKNKISKNIYRIIDADIYGDTHYVFYSSIVNQCRKSPEKKILLKRFLDKFKMNNFNSYSRVALRSKSYITFLTYKATAFAIIKKDDKDLAFEDIYNEIILNNNGEIREKVLISFLIRGGYGSTATNRSKVYKDALKYIKNIYYYKNISNLADVLTFGSKAYAFELQDTSGNIVSLTQFKGKTIILDFWFTGCGSCMELAKDMDANVLPIYKDNKNVVFISISVDKSKDLWIKSIKSGEYTHLNSVNLFTETKGLNHALIKNYQIQMFPTLMLIDKNENIYSPALPKNSMEMVKVINSAMAL